MQQVSWPFKVESACCSCASSRQSTSRAAGPKSSRWKEVDISRKLCPLVNSSVGR